VSEYARHEKKITDLCKKPSESKTSIAEKYVNLVSDDVKQKEIWKEVASKEIQNNEIQTKKGWTEKNIHYLYITLSDKVMGTNAKYSWHPVCLIHKEELLNAFDDFKEIFFPTEK
jgi:hypothetical protein